MITHFSLDDLKNSKRSLDARNFSLEKHPAPN